MLSNISWTDFAIFIVTILFTYYAVIFFIFYKMEVLSFSRRFFMASPSDLDNQLGHEEFQNFTDPKFLESEIKLCLEEAHRKKLIKEEIIMSLQIVLGNYNPLKIYEHRNAINRNILTECKNICSIHLDEESVKRMW